MAISFTRSIITRLEKEIVDLQSLVREQKKKRDRMLSQIKQLQRDQKLSQSMNDLSSKISREVKLKKAIDEIDGLLAQSTKQLAEKQARLVQQQQQKENN
ncbi:hypothetical protein DFQ01_107171 [Paenibacillus cellulosilyticus]|uniref:Uncharacterized protein n=1 Tax=Paenibacillus cellulosilyticus TaxID=375489 RepID=A0A2V2YY65_9BACL|nr:hypothetical protein [Paenibacillus cellulosilyticus]PWW03273.1 hypothetical protein DFQ01_107171 [Paenibacillus cellulosilyticus]QKS43751.1 hypothetical protein HUB94_04370 [Paenibacillus cellulosilyticus]